MNDELASAATASNSFGADNASLYAVLAVSLVAVLALVLALRK